MIKSQKKQAARPQASLEACNAFTRKTDRSLKEQADKDQRRRDIAAAKDLLKGTGG